MCALMFRRLLRVLLRQAVLDIINHDVRIWGDGTRLHIAKTARMNNTLFNLSSGAIRIGEYTFAGHNVSIITGTHPVEMKMEQRMNLVPSSGRDISIGNGVWIGSNAIILGPCTIGNNAVIAAGALVREDVPENVIVAGVPARIIRAIE